MTLRYFQIPVKNTVHESNTNGGLTKTYTESQPRDFWDDFFTVLCAVILKAVAATALRLTELTK